MCRCNIAAGVDVDGADMDVQLTRFAFIDASAVTVCDPEIEVRCMGRVDYANAVTLSAAIAAAAAMARVSLGREAAA